MNSAAEELLLVATRRCLSDVVSPVLFLKIIEESGFGETYVIV